MLKRLPAAAAAGSRRLSARCEAPSCDRQEAAKIVRSLWRSRVYRAQTAAILLGAALLVQVIGCSSSSPIKAGAISISDLSGSVSGQLKALSVGMKAQVSMMPVSDATRAGVDWTATCGGSPVNGSVTGGACGTFSPAHTPDGVPAVYTAPSTVPIGNNVTITASVTGDPSASSSITLPVNVPITITFISNPPASLATGATVPIRVQLTNDTTGAGATWSAACGSSGAGACGTFSPATGTQTTYTAPAAPPGSDGVVTITATSIADATKSASTKITITSSSVGQPLSISVTPTALTVGVRSAGKTENAGLIAVVSGDSTNAGVDWTLRCSPSSPSCGTISPSHTASGAAVVYTAPTSLNANPVTITATAHADGITSASAAVTIAGTPTISVTVSAPASVATQATAKLTAVVANDASNSGVTWAVSCPGGGDCGTITNAAGSGTSYTATYAAPAAAPAGGLITITATPKATTPAGNPGLATIMITPPTIAIAFLQAPPQSMSAGAAAPVSAAVSNDTTPPGGVTWSVSCGSSTAGGCGYIFPPQTASGVNAVYTAPPVPPGGPVTITAAATSSCTTQSNATTCTVQVTTPVTIAASSALSVGFVPTAPTQLQAGSTVKLIAAVANDATNAGVDWQVCANGCGFFTVTPAIPAIPATAKTPYVPPVPAVTATTVKGWSNGLPIPYTAPGTPPPAGSMTITAAAHADGTASDAANVTITDTNTGPALQGVVRAGTLPVTGAQVALYAAGTSGYGSASTLVSAPGQNPYAATDANGMFTIPAGYSCPQTSSQMYLVAIGGQAGGNPENPNLAMMTALGTCATLSSSPVVVNEVTTVASAWAVSSFAANPLTTGQISYLNIGSSSGNVTGLANAFATVNNLVNLSSGQPLFDVPAGNASVPYVEINTLADIFNACTVTGGGVAGDGSVCGNLFTYANPYSGINGTVYSGVPSDTLQAAFEIAQNPGLENGGNLPFIQGLSLFGMVSSAAPFQPVLTTIPKDFSLSLNFTGGGGLSSTSGANFFAVDASGNLWITDTSTNSVTEWDNQGAAISSSSGYTTSTLAAPGPVVVDAGGDTWICGQNGLTKLNFLGVELPGSPFGGGGLTSSGCLNMTIDGAGNFWAINRNSVAKFDSLGDPLSPATGYTVPVSPTDADTVTLLPPLAIDASNNVWLGANAPAYSGALSLTELNNASGLPSFLTPNSQSASTPPSNFVTSGGGPDQTQIAADSSGNIWATVIPASNESGSLIKIPPYGGIGTTDLPSIVLSYSGSGRYPLANSQGIALDGAGTIWVGNGGSTESSLNVPPNVTGFKPAFPSGYFEYASPSLSNRPLSLAADTSGNVWALLNNGTVTEFVGIATPAVTPLSLAVKNKKLGGTP
ncbi:hypothetical protein [Paracidobacterium acidisoli]|nr:hypothetical protein [Paracidobacterium acidisoli]MBT9333105.1 hypothetical protein [Paracidobacterium acidisoli]